MGVGFPQPNINFHLIPRGLAAGLFIKQLLFALPPQGGRRWVPGGLAATLPLPSRFKQTDTRTH